MSPAVAVPPMTAFTLPLMVVPRVIVSVAPELVDTVYVGVWTVIVITAPDDVAFTPRPVILVSAFIAAASPVAMDVNVLPVARLPNLDERA